MVGNRQTQKKGTAWKRENFCLTYLFNLTGSPMEKKLWRFKAIRHFFFWGGGTTAANPRKSDTTFRWVLMWFNFFFFTRHRILHWSWKKVKMEQIIQIHPQTLPQTIKITTRLWKLKCQISQLYVFLLRNIVPPTCFPQVLCLWSYDARLKN